MKKYQHQIKFENLAADRAAVEKILLAAASKFNLFDNTYESTIPETIRSIVEGKGVGFGLGARVRNDLILVDFFPRPNLLPKFQEIYNFILDDLVNTFPGISKVIHDGDPDYLDIR